MLQPSRAYTRLLNALVDERIASAGPRSPWFHMTSDERSDYLAEVERRLLEIQHTTFNVLAAQYFTLAENPRSIDEHLEVLRACRERLDATATATYRNELDRDIQLYGWQQQAMRGFEQAWRKALKLLQAGDGLQAPRADLLPRLQRLARLAQRKLDDCGSSPGQGRMTLFARAQGWQTVTDRYQALLNDPAGSGTALIALGEVPQVSDDLPVNLSLLLMEERPGYVRLTLALVDPCYDGRYKDLHLDQGRLMLQARGVMYVSFGTPARALAWQQHYRLKQEPAELQSPTFAPIRSVLVRSHFVMELLGLFAVSESSQRSGFFAQVLEQGMCLRVVNVDRKVPNQLGLRIFAEAHGAAHRGCADVSGRLGELLDRHADLASFATIASGSYAASHYDPDRDGSFVDVRTLERRVGFGERLYLLELPFGDQYLAATPFAVLDGADGGAGSRHLSAAQVRAAYLHNEAFFQRLQQLREEGEAGCRWLASPRERRHFEAHWLRLLERNHLTPGGLLPPPAKLRDNRRDIKGNALGKLHWEQAFAEQVWGWPEGEVLLQRLGREMASQVSNSMLQDPYLQQTLACVWQRLAAVLPPLPYRLRLQRLLHLLLSGEAQWPGVTSALDAQVLLGDTQGRDLRKRALCQVLLLHAWKSLGNEPAATAHETPDARSPSGRIERPDPYLLLNSRLEAGRGAESVGIIADDKYRGYHRFSIDADSDIGACMNDLDMPFMGGLSTRVEALCRHLAALSGPLSGLETYWRLQLMASAFLLRNGYHSFFETICLAARHEPALPEAAGDRLLALFDHCRKRQVGGGALYRGAAGLILPLVNGELSSAQRLVWPSLHAFGLRTAGEAG